MMRLSIAAEFSPCPAGRTAAEGPFSAERFRAEHLVPRLAEATAASRTLVVDFEGVDSCSAAFIEEAFGGLVRDPASDPAAIDMTLVVHGGGPAWDGMVEDALKAMARAASRRAKAA